jgi:hypothetical protein
MDWLWNWGGECFGYRDGDNLWTYAGKHVGKFHGDEVYGSDGRYLGEIKSGNRLITHTSKAHWQKYIFTPYSRRSPYARYASYVGYAMYAGHEDFPAADSV